MTENKELKQFVQMICEQKKVFCLTLNDGYAQALSNFFVDDEDEQIEVFCFWSKEQSAKACIQSDWSDYQVSSLELSVFMEDWCIGMSNENYGVGIDFNGAMSGMEVDPLELLIEIIEYLIAQKQELKFKKFKSLADLLHHSKQALDYED